MATASYRKLHELALARAEGYASKIRKLYSDATSRFVDLASDTKLEEGEQFFFEDYPLLAKEVKKTVTKLAVGIERIVLRSTTAEWAKGLADSKGMIDYVLKRYGIKDVDALTDEDVGKFISNREGALAAFQKRKIGGLSLSDKAWDLAQHQKIEAELARSISLGRSADEVAKEMQQWLVEPDKLFRRVRDEFGVLRLSKNAKEYSPAIGTYRSSYKNALRLVRTETNMAYRNAEIESYQQKDYVVGYEVHRSVTPYPCPVCEALAGKYPKEFVWNGWHPQCRCFITPILITEEEMSERRRAVIDGREYDTSTSVNAVTEMPTAFGRWVDENSERIERAYERGRLPYFLADNKWSWEDFYKEISSK